MKYVVINHDDDQYQESLYYNGKNISKSYISKRRPRNIKYEHRDSHRSKLGINIISVQEIIKFKVIVSSSGCFIHCTQCWAHEAERRRSINNRLHNKRERSLFTYHTYRVRSARHDLLYGKRRCVTSSTRPAACATHDYKSLCNWLFVNQLFVFILWSAERPFH